MSGVVLYNASFEPLGRVSFRHAVKMLVREVAVVHEQLEDKMIGPHPWPTAVRLVRYVVAHWMHRPAGVTRSGVLKRDRHACGYCGRKATTVDHVVPTSRGGPWSWENAVAACGRCNSRKAARTPAEAGMTLRTRLWAPTRADLLKVD